MLVIAEIRDEAVLKLLKSFLAQKGIQNFEVYNTTDYLKLVDQETAAVDAKQDFLDEFSKIFKDLPQADIPPMKTEGPMENQNMENLNPTLSTSGAPSIPPMKVKEPKVEQNLENLNPNGPSTSGAPNISPMAIKEPTVKQYLENLNPSGLTPSGARSQEPKVEQSLENLNPGPSTSGAPSLSSNLLHLMMMAVQKPGLTTTETQTTPPVTFKEPKVEQNLENVNLAGSSTSGAPSFPPNLLHILMMAQNPGSATSGASKNPQPRPQPVKLPAQLKQVVKGAPANPQVVQIDIQKLRSKMEAYGRKEAVQQKPVPSSSPPSKRGRLENPGQPTVPQSSGTPMGIQNIPTPTSSSSSNTPYPQVPNPRKRLGMVQQHVGKEQAPSKPTVFTQERLMEILKEHST